MINQKMPDFMPTVSTARQTRAGRNQYIAYQRLAAIYLLRLTLGSQKNMRRTQLCDFFEDDLGRITGLDEFHRTGNGEDFGDDELPFSNGVSKAVLVKCMRQQLSNLLEEGIGSSESLFDNIRLLSNTLKLSSVEQEILVLRLLMPLLEVFRETVINQCGTCTMQSTVDYLRLMTTRPAREILKALQPNSQLQQMGWLKIHSGIVDLEDKLILADSLLDIMLRQHDSAEALFANFFRPSSRTKLVIDDYGHLQNDLNVLQPYLRSALDEKQAEVNILIYGPPGVGKVKDWAAKKRFAGTATIWSSVMPSANFETYTNACYVDAFGMAAFMNQLEATLSSRLSSYVRRSGEMQVEHGSWWPYLHLEQGKIWIISDDVEWVELD